MSNLKLKAATVVLVLAVVVSALSFSATTVVYAFLPGDANHDGIVDISDVALLGMSWQAAVGQANYNPNCDFDNDGIVDISDLAILGYYWQMQIVQADVSIMPQSLNVKSEGNWVTCLIRLPKNVGSSELNADSIKLNGTIAAQKIEQVKNDPHELTVKFSREAVVTLVQSKLQALDDGKFSVVTLIVVGMVSPKVAFWGSDTIRVIQVDEI